MKKLTLKERLRVGHVRRWHIVRVARDQTIAEHMYRVALIVGEICDRLGVNQELTHLANSWALVHDIVEVVAGDTPTPTKKLVDKTTGMHDTMNLVELSVDDSVYALYVHLEKFFPLVLKIVKIADLMEAVDFLSVEGMGSHAKEVEALIRRDIDAEIQLAREQFPEYGWVNAIHSIGREIQQ